MARFTTARDRKQGTAAIARRAPSPIGTRVPPHLWRLACASGRLYSPGGCGCALLMAPVMAAAMGLAALSLGLAVLALVCLAIAIALTVNEVRRAHGGSSHRGGFVVAIAMLYLASVPYLAVFTWFWLVD